MTPNPNSPIFIKHEVPNYACNNSKKLSQYFFLLRGEIMKNRWNGISEADISLTYNTYDGCTEVEIVFRDKNNHAHRFTMQLVPDNVFGDTDEDRFRLLYLFEGKFDENAISIRSFAAYLAIPLEYKGFEPTLMKCDKGLDIPYSVEYAYDGICNLIDITQSNIKPLVWFYTKEPSINSFESVCYYLAGVKSKLQLECCNGRWNKIVPALQNFTFRLPLQPINLTGEIEAIQEQMEAAFNTTFEVVTDEEQIDKKLMYGYFKIHK